jgi:predicted small metal-binding protein
VFLVTATLAVSLVGVSVGSGLAVGARVATSAGDSLEFELLSELVPHARRKKRMMKIRETRKDLDRSIFAPSPNHQYKTMLMITQR